MRPSRLLVAVMLAWSALALSTLTGPALAQAWPQRSIKLLVPFAAGGNTDVVGRLIAAPMGEMLGQQIVVENKTGGGSTIATDAVAKSPPDGYTLLLTTVAHAVNPALFKKLPFDPVKDFQPLGIVANVPILIAVHPSLGVKDMTGFIALLKANPGKYNYGTGGVGSAEHLGAALFAHLAKVDVVHIPYRGAALATTDLLAGQIGFMATPISNLIQHHRTGSLIGLGTGASKRTAAAPDLPPIAETVPGYEAYTWNALYAPAGTPQPIVEQINRAAQAAVKLPAVVERMRDLGIDPVEGSTPASHAAYLVAEMEKWVPLMRAAGASLD